MKVYPKRCETVENRIRRGAAGIGPAMGILNRSNFYRFDNSRWPDMPYSGPGCYILDPPIGFVCCDYRKEDTDIDKQPSLLKMYETIADLMSSYACDTHRCTVDVTDYTMRYVHDRPVKTYSILIDSQETGLYILANVFDQLYALETMLFIGRDPHQIPYLIMYQAEQGIYAAMIAGRIIKKEKGE